jgi:hypothetical protein
MSAKSPFEPRIVAALGAALAILLAESMLLTGAGGRVVGDPVGANTFSKSAVGQLGLFEMLQKLGYQAVRGERDVLALLGTNGILVLAEPPTGGWSNDNFLGAKKILVVLPKWNGVRSTERNDWIGTAQIVPTFIPQSVLFTAAGQGEVVRVKEPSAFRKTLDLPSPTISGAMQLMKNSKLKPIVSTDEGILLGEFKEGLRKVWVLADPDPLENHGIGAGDNLAFASTLFYELLEGKAGTLVFDETLHGFERKTPSALKFLLEFPFNLIALQIAVAVALLLTASIGRFGAPEIPDRALNNGKRDLIVNAASLIDHAGHHAAILRRYASMVLQDTGRLLRAPRQANDAELAAWLDRAGERRGLRTESSAPLRRIASEQSGSLAALLSDARAIHRWKEEILNGIPGRLGDH